jgi:hypothetical protein
MKERYAQRVAKRIKRLEEGRRNPTDYPVPRPTGPYSSNVALITFESYRAARQGIGCAATLKLFHTFGAYEIKPHRGSVGVIWNNRAYWWSEKGLYRAGKMGSPRPPLQHLVWEKANGRKIPPMHEIFFRDRNRNNFDPANLELLSKAELRLRCIELGEVKQITNEQRREVSAKRWTRQSRSQTQRLLQQFQSGGAAIKFLSSRKETITHGPKL